MPEFSVLVDEGQGKRKRSFIRVSVSKHWIREPCYHECDVHTGKIFSDRGGMWVLIGKSVEELALGVKVTLCNVDKDSLPGVVVASFRESDDRRSVVIVEEYFINKESDLVITGKIVAIGDLI